MLELIVLGRVPGTDFQITFTQISSVISLCAAIKLIKFDIKLYHSPASYQQFDQLRQHRIFQYTVREFYAWLLEASLYIAARYKQLLGLARAWSLKSAQVAAKMEKKLVLNLSKAIRQVRMWQLALRESLTQSTP